MANGRDAPRAHGRRVDQAEQLIGERHIRPKPTLNVGIGRPRIADGLEEAKGLRVVDAHVVPRQHLRSREPIAYEEIHPRRRARVAHGAIANPLGHEPHPLAAIRLGVARQVRGVERDGVEFDHPRQAQ